MGNSFAAWAVATVGAVVSLTTGDIAEGLRWSDRTLRHYIVLGGGEAGGPLTLRGALLAARGTFFEAAVLLAAARTQARRGGQRWPRNPMTWRVVALVDDHLSAADRDQAYEQGRQLVLADLPLPHFSSTNLPGTDLD